MRYCFDIDGTLCDTPNDKNGKPDYLNSSAIPSMIKSVNDLYDQGHFIIIQTARGKSSNIDWTDFTKQQLASWGLRYHELFPMFCKPTADFFIDDKAINAEDWKKAKPKTMGILAGSFDLIHPGYVKMFKNCKDHCNHLTVALHDNPHIERSHKLHPIHNIQERKEILESIKYIDDIIPYSKEADLLSILANKKYNIRFLGEDYINQDYTGRNLDLKIIWISRGHGYSTTKTKQLIYDSIKKNNEQFKN